ncbi:uncharacterized protein LOC129602439 [Paramacrobiotus metropolitanus]|uniref:uncharacterized protein LOC129602439 n=1 Tax=Paramacrobiotus metropolitanus TaxID=2943436 RepID=UPI002445D577|nr:uncharacterized protein LOC129602439 [Paramacrobiotus metropolitanus]
MGFGVVQCYITIYTLLFAIGFRGLARSLAQSRTVEEVVEYLPVHRDMTALVGQFNSCFTYTSAAAFVDIFFDIIIYVNSVLKSGVLNISPDDYDVLAINCVFIILSTQFIGILFAVEAEDDVLRNIREVSLDCKEAGRPNCQLELHVSVTNI